MNAQMSHQQVIFGAQTMDSLISDSVATRRFSMILLAVFAVLALLLASRGNLWRHFLCGWTAYE